MYSPSPKIHNIQYSSKLEDTNFYRYILSRSAHSNRNIIILFAVFNLLLIIPDMININTFSSQVTIATLRIIFSLCLMLFLFSLHRMRNFKRYSTILSGIEFTGVLLFLFTIAVYDSPHYLIQTLGFITLIIGIFLIPNKWLYMVTISTISLLAFILTTMIFFPHIDLNERLAGLTYIIIIGALCAIGARGTEKFRLREYQHIDDLRTISTTDPLTKACNRLKLEKEGHQLIKFAHQKKTPLSLIFVDIDNMKTINDKYGHLIGDQILIEVVARIRHYLSKDDLVARWGGDEFIIIMPGKKLNHAIQTAEKIRNNIVSESFPGGLHTTCSFGVSTIRPNSTFSSLIYEADQLMYKGKQKGKNRIESDLTVFDNH